jgi:hypothetical protein
VTVKVTAGATAAMADSPTKAATRNRVVLRISSLLHAQAWLQREAKRHPSLPDEMDSRRFP